MEHRTGALAPPVRADFEAALTAMLREAQGDKSRTKPYTDVWARVLHGHVGGYPGPEHRMPICCSVMCGAMQAGDEVRAEPPKGVGPNLMIRYKLPR